MVLADELDKDLAVFLHSYCERPGGAIMYPAVAQ
jgi:hypothetical protein